MSDEISEDALKWLQQFAKHAIRKGLLAHSETAPEDVCKELFERCLVLPTKGNDGDFPWHGKVEITSDLADRIWAKLGIDSEIGYMFRGNPEFFIKVSSEVMEKIKAGSGKGWGISASELIWTESAEAVDDDEESTPHDDDGRNE